MNNDIQTVYDVHVQLKSIQRNVSTKENVLSLVSLELCAVSIYSHNKFALSTNNFVLTNNAMCNMLLEMWPQDRSGLSRTVICTESILGVQYIWYLYNDYLKIVQCSMCNMCNVQCATSAICNVQYVQYVQCAICS